jgi:hypothetical protein
LLKRRQAKSTSAYQLEIARGLIAAGADVRAKNRRGAEPLHYAADGMPGSRTFNPHAQAATVAASSQPGPIQMPPTRAA